MSSDAQSPFYNPWHPITDPVTLKHLGKLSEEMGEAIASISRCIIQGVDGCEPVTGKSNRVWLTEELADVICNINLTIEHLKLDTDSMSLRANGKRHRLKQWHDMA